MQAVDFLNDLSARIFSIRYVVELFSYLHDPLKLEEYSDTLHGARAADFAALLKGTST